MKEFETWAPALPADLEIDVARSLFVPQRGPHHCESVFLRGHLERVYNALEETAEGCVHSAAPEHIATLLVEAAQAQFDLAALYVELHDVDKATCLSLVDAQGNRRAVTWDEWCGFVASSAPGRRFDVEADVIAACEENGIVQISYFQDTPEGSRQHGPVAAQRLAQFPEIPEIVRRAIATHEVAYQFAGDGSNTGIAIGRFRKLFEGWTDDDVAFALLVNYADEMGSLGVDGQPDISAFLTLARSWLASRKYAQLEAGIVQVRIAGTPRLNTVQLDKLLGEVLRSADAFETETVEQAHDRIIATCILPAFDETRLREVIAGLVSDGTLGSAVDTEALIRDLMVEGKIGKDVGRQLGRANPIVTAAVKVAIPS